MAVFKVLDENTKGRDFIVGDIHGAYSYLEEALNLVNFCPETDRVISVGDLIDRGPESHRCLEFLEKPWFHAIKGNHEDLFLDMVSKDGDLDGLKAEFNIRNGMGWVIDLTKEERQELYTAFSQLPIAIEVPTARGTVGVVHADIPDNMNWQDFVQNIKSENSKVTETALWGRNRIKQENEKGVEGIDRIFFGHTPQEHGAKRLGNCYYIDTGAVFKMIYGNLVSKDFTLTMTDIMVKTQFTSEQKGEANKNVNTIIANSNSYKKPFGKYTK